MQDAVKKFITHINMMVLNFALKFKRKYINKKILQAGLRKLEVAFSY